MSAPTDWIKDAERAGAELRDLIQQAHAAIKDMRATYREFDQLRIEASAMLSTEARKEIEPVLQGLIEDMGAQIGRARDDSVEAVQASFDSLARILRGEDDDGPSIQEMTVAYRIAHLLQAEPGVTVKEDGTMVVNLDDAARRHRAVGRPKGKPGGRV